MRASTILLITFIIWLTAKGKLQDYWALATANNVGNESGADAATNTDIGPGDETSHAGTSPGFSWGDILGGLLD